MKKIYKFNKFNQQERKSQNNEHFIESKVSGYGITASGFSKKKRSLRTFFWEFLLGILI